MHKRLIMLVGITLLILILAGCAQEATEVAFADACNAANDGQQISTVGYFATGVTLYCSSSGGDYRCGMDFVDAPGSENRFTADVLEGNGRNELAEVPDDFTDADIQIKTDDGSVIGVGQQTRISGEMLIGEGVCLMTVDKIVAVAE